MNYLVSALNTVREAVYTPPTKSTFLQTGELTVEEFVKAGDYLVYKFRTWSWSPADPSKRNPHLPEDKQFLVTRHVPRVRKLDELLKGGWEGDDEDEEGEGFGEAKGSAGKVEGIKTVNDKGVVEDLTASEDDIPDMEDDDDDDEAIIRDDSKGKKGTKNGSSSITAAGRSSTRDPERTYTLYITYSNFYHTPRLFLSGYDGPTQMPLDPQAMMEDIVGDYKDKTVTIEEFPLLEGGVRMASVHPCALPPRRRWGRC
jgi:ubiquitin-like-conjugating enzyme ATG3